MADEILVPENSDILSELKIGLKNISSRLSTMALDNLTNAQLQEITTQVGNVRTQLESITEFENNATTVDILALKTNYESLLTQLETLVTNYENIDTSSKIDNIYLKNINQSNIYRVKPNEINIDVVSNFRVWQLLDTRKFDTNIKPKKLFEDIFADAIVFVKPTGDDTAGDGTFNNPYRSIYAGLRHKINGASGGKLAVYVESSEYVDSESWNGTGIYADEVNIIAYNGIVISKVTDNTVYNGRIQDTKKIYCEGFIFDGGNGSFTTLTTGVDFSYQFYKNCKFINSKTNGFNAVTNGLYVFENCIADYNTLDGFNYHNYYTGTKKQLVIEINCQGNNNGTSGNTNNGSTVHDGGQIIRINGEYLYNGNRNIHDINDCVSWNLGTIATDGKEDGQANFVIGSFADTTDSSIMYLDTCSTGGSALYDTAISSINDGSAKLYTYNLNSGDCILNENFDTYTI